MMKELVHYRVGLASSSSLDLIVEAAIQNGHQACMEVLYPLHEWLHWHQLNFVMAACTSGKVGFFGSCFKRAHYLLTSSSLHCQQPLAEAIHRCWPCFYPIILA